MAEHMAPLHFFMRGIRHEYWADIYTVCCYRLLNYFICTLQRKSFKSTRFAPCGKQGSLFYCVNDNHWLIYVETMSCWFEENLLHACLGPLQLNSAIKHLFIALFLAFSSAPCWLQAVESIIKQIKADCSVNFHLILATGCSGVMLQSKQRSREQQMWDLVNS